MVLVYIILAIVFLYVLNRLLKRKVIDLKDKKVLITGAASGIGRMLSEDMAKKVFYLNQLPLMYIYIENLKIKQ